MEKWSKVVTNEEVHERIENKRALLNNFLRRKASLVGHILGKIAFFMMTLKSR